MASLILTLVGPDRPGLVSALSETIAVQGGSWLESQMARLAGQFAGILLIEAPDTKVDALASDLHRLEANGFRLTIERTGPETPPAFETILLLDLVGQDRPGIVRDITQVLAKQKVNIEEFTTKVISGSFSAEQMFHATARLRVPDGMAAKDLKDVLEHLGNELMVDVSLNDP